MATRTSTTRRSSATRRPAAAQSRGAGRFSRPLPAQRSAPKRGKKQAGTLASLMSALPMAKAQKRGRGKGKGGPAKAGPAVGLLMAGAGAILGRRQMKRRRAEAPLEHPTPTA